MKGTESSLLFSVTPMLLPLRQVENIAANKAFVKGKEIDLEKVVGPILTDSTPTLL